MTHHNAKFGNKMCGGLEDIIWVNINILTLHCDLDSECSAPLTPRLPVIICDVEMSKAMKVKGIVEKTKKNRIFLGVWLQIEHIEQAFGLT